jgi:hypothetical protein
MLTNTFKPSSQSSCMIYSLLTLLSTELTNFWHFCCLLFPRPSSASENQGQYTSKSLGTSLKFRMRHFNSKEDQKNTTKCNPLRM